MPRLVTIESYATREEAALAQMALESAGIESFVEGGTLVGNFWVLGNVTGGIKLQVADEHEAAAREIIAEASSQPRQRLPTATVSACPHCKSPVQPGFDVCWSCGRKLLDVPPPDLAQIEQPDHEAVSAGGDPGTPPISNVSELDDQSTAIGDEIVDRAWRATVIGLCFPCLAPIPSVYSTVLLLLVMFKDHQLSQRRQRRSNWALALNCLVLLVIALIVYLSASR